MWGQQVKRKRLRRSILTLCGEALRYRFQQQGKKHISKVFQTKLHCTFCCYKVFQHQYFFLPTGFERAMKIEDDVDDEITTMYKLLEDICRTLKIECQDELFEHLFDKIESIPHDLVVPQTIDLLNLFTAAEVIFFLFWEN